MLLNSHKFIYMEANKPITGQEERKDNVLPIKQDSSIITTNKSPNEHQKELQEAKEKDIITAPAIEKKKEKEYHTLDYQYEGYKHFKYSGNM